VPESISERVLFQTTYYISPAGHFIKVLPITYTARMFNIQCLQGIYVESVKIRRFFSRKHWILDLSGRSSDLSLFSEAFPSQFIGTVAGISKNHHPA